MRSTTAAAFVLFGIAMGAGGALAAPGVLSGGPEPNPIGTDGRLAYQGPAFGSGSQDLQSFTGRSFSLQLDAPAGGPGYSITGAGTYTGTTIPSADYPQA